jgi:cell division protein FtsQ
MDSLQAVRPPLRALAVPLGALADGTRAVLRRRRLRRRLGAALLALVLLVAGWLWLRNSPLVSVDHVRIRGVSGPDAAAIEAALTGAGTRMTTLHVDVGRLRAAVAPFRVVRDLSVSTSLPHDLRIRVIEQLPVAALLAGGERTAVAADGAVLGPALAASRLPVVHAAVLPGGDRVRDTRVLDYLTVLGAAPAPLARRVVRVYTGPTGLTVGLRAGPLLYFGDATRPHAKWAAATRVLADPSSAGASYVDVRLPERPAAGVPIGTVSAATAQVTATDPTAAALAAALASAVGASPGASGVPGTSGGGVGATSGASAGTGTGIGATSGGAGTTPAAGAAAAAGSGPGVTPGPTTGG